MTVYHVSYIGADDLTYHYFFSSRKGAVKEQGRLKKYDMAAPSSEDEDERIVKMVFEIATIKCDISKRGILKMLNTYFAETQ